ncbi:MAG: hypothetical protein GWN30_07810, partial [Gammaproteobacteria bacterium]|nr:hypothetical protein [Gammaproteobacteria bacterium]
MEYYNQIPDYKIETDQPAPIGYPESETPDAYTPEPEERDSRLAFLDFCKTNPAPANTKAVYYEIARLAAGGRPHHGILHAGLDYIDQRKDCADFVMHSILWLLYRFRDHPRLKDDFIIRAESSILKFKYWPSEPGIDSMCTWTENHQILFASAAFLAGQMFPGSLFSNSGRTGAELIEVHRKRIITWLELRFKTGFSEYLSNVYYDEDITALLSLIEFSQDEEIVERSKIVLDLMLMDMALNSWKGIFGSTHGRSYSHSKMDLTMDGTNNTLKVLFGMGQFSSFDNMSAVPLAISQNYEAPPLIEAIAQDLKRSEMINRQRMGIKLDDADRWGLSYDNFEDAMVFLSLEAYL